MTCAFGASMRMSPVSEPDESLAEGWTILALGLYLAEPTRRRAAGCTASPRESVAGLAGVWLAAAQAGAFNEDPARLAAFQPA